MDVRLPGMDGLSAMKQLTARHGPIPIVVITAFGNLETAVTAVQNGAFDYLSKPFDLEQAATVIRRACHRQRSPGEGRGRGCHGRRRAAGRQPGDARSLQADCPGRRQRLLGLDHRRERHGEGACGSGDSSPLVACRSAVGADQSGFAQPDLGRERTVWPRQGSVHRRQRARSGLLELADGATVFFDEAADIPPNVQVKLLRVIEQLEVTPVGDTRPRKSAFRAITATNRQLERQFADGSFRQDLYFRLAVFEIHVPPLRSRAEDIPLLAERFLARSSSSQSRPTRFTPSAIAELCRRQWPGNVRELRNAIEHAALVARGGAIGPEHLPPPIEMHGTDPADVTSALARAVREWTAAELVAARSDGHLHEQFLTVAESPLFETVLHHTLHNRAAAADLLGIHRATLRKKLH